jgi:type IX secretion system PorP/SprF family membrane protein
MKKLSIYLILILAFAFKSKAQSQEHYSLYMMHQPFFNPASMASYSKLTAAALYKTQWVGYDGAPKVGAFNVLKPFKKSSIGLTVVNDQIGINNNTAIAGSYAYKLRLRGYSRLAFGVSASVHLLESDFGKVDILDNTDPTYNGGVSTTSVEPNFEFGTYYYTNKFYLGLAVQNILENKIAIKNEADGVTDFGVDKIHYYLHSGYGFVLDDKSNINVSALMKHISGASIQYDLNVQYEYDRTIGLGVSYRSSNEIVGMLSYKFLPGLKFAYAYDYHIGELSNYSSGSHEIMLIYQFNPPKETIVSVPRF